MKKEFKRKLENNIRTSEQLLHNNDIELKYHYGPLSYLKFVAGGTPIPKWIDILNKEDHSLIKRINSKKLLDELADN